MPKTKTRGNGQGSAYKQGNSWTAQTTLWIYDEDGNKIRRFMRKKGFKTKKDALDYIRELANPDRPDAATITFNDLYNEWSKQHYPRISKDAENGYKAAYAKCWPIYARQFIGLRTSDFQRLIDNAVTLKGKPLGVRGKEDIRSLISQMYKYAIQNDYCQKNYVQFVVMEKKEKSKKDAFTKDELKVLWKDYNDGHDFTGYILIMIYTGMRYGEMSTIRLENIHLDQQYLIGGIKTEAGINREIPICNKIMPIFKKLMPENGEKFLTMHEKVYYNNHHETLKRLGVRDLDPHCCRHTTATALADENVAPAIIIAILGHKDYATTLENYTHIKLAEKIEAVNKLK